MKRNVQKVHTEQAFWEELPPCSNAHRDKIPPCGDPPHFDLTGIRNYKHDPSSDPKQDNIAAAGAVDRELYSGFFEILIYFFFVDFGVREVSQRRDLTIPLQMAFGRARDDL